MEISSLTVKLIILLTPGLVSYFIYKRLTTRSNNRSDLMFIFISILLGVISYSILQLIYALIFDGYTLRVFDIISTDSGYIRYPEDNNLPYWEIVFASIIGIVIAYLFAAVDTKLWINKLGNWLNLTVKLTDESLYVSYLARREITWIYVRSIKNQLTYFGRIYSINDKESIKEMVLEEVDIYSYPETQYLYSVPTIYLSLKDDEIIIEQANIAQNGKEEITTASAN